jgi:hypothetical protein
MDTARFRSFGRMGFYLSQLVNGVLLISGQNVSKILDATTFEEKFSFRMSSRKFTTGASLTSNGSAVTFLSGIFQDPQSPKLLVSNPVGGRSQFTCDVIQQMKLPLVAQINVSPGADGGILVSIKDSRPKNPTLILLLSPTLLSKALPADVIGTCKPVS